MNYTILKKQNKKTINKYKNKFKKSETISFKFRKKTFKNKKKDILIKKSSITLKLINICEDMLYILNK